MQSDKCSHRRKKIDRKVSKYVTTRFYFFGLNFALYAFTAVSFISQPNFLRNSNFSSSVNHSCKTCRAPSIRSFSLPLNTLLPGPCLNIVGTPFFIAFQIVDLPDVIKSSPTNPSRAPVANFSSSPFSSFVIKYPPQIPACRPILHPQQRLVIGKQDLIDFKNVVLPVHNEVLHNHIKLAGVG